MQQYTKLPKTLYRLQNSLRFKLRQKQDMLSKGKTQYDYVANQHGLYVPRTNINVNDANKFQPNGILLYSMGDSFKELLRSTLKGGLRYYYVIQIPQGTQVPEKTVIYQDPIEDYMFWLQTSETVEPKQFSSKMELLLLGNKIHRKKQFKPLILPQTQRKPQDKPQGN